MAKMQKEKALEGYLVAAARTGDRIALERLVTLSSPRLMGHAVRLLGEAEGARDIIQEAWVEIIRSLHKLREIGAFMPWAMRIVSRRVAKVIAGRQRDRRLAGEFAQETADCVLPCGDDALEMVRVRRALVQLPPDHAATIALFYLSEMSVAEVALSLDVPVGTIKTRLMHARRKLRVILDGENNE